MQKISIKQNWQLIKTLWRMRLSHLMVFRLSFFGATFVDGTLFLVQLLMFQAMYSWVDTIGTFSRGQMFIFVGTFSLINALNMVIYFFGTLGIASKIRDGSLDHYLTKPMSPLLRLTFENLNPGSLPLIVLSAVIIGYGVEVSGVHVNALTVLLYLLMVALMTLLWYDCMVVLRTLPFFFISTSAVDEIEGNLIDGCFRVPGMLFTGVWKVVFWFVLPYGVMATVPTQLLTGVLTLGGAAYAVGLTVVFTAFTMWFWKFGLRHYKSASS